MVYEKHHNLKMLFIQTLTDLLLFEEWSESLLAHAELQCGFAKGYCQIIFPGGLMEIIDFLEDTADKKMLELLASREKPVKVTDTIALALKIRIKDCLPKLVYLKNSIYFTRPTNTRSAIKIAFRTCNLIWKFAGDTSVDYNYYTKRSLLLSVYVTSIIYYLQDDSENNIELDQYINESLHNIVKTNIKLKNVFKLPKLVDIPILRLFS